MARFLFGGPSPKETLRRGGLVLSDNHLLAALGSSAESVLAGCRISAFQAGDQINLAVGGERLVGFVVSGLIATRWLGCDGGALQVALVNQDSAVGLAEALGDLNGSAEHYAITEARVLLAPIDVLMALLRDAAGSQVLLRHMASQLESIRREHACAVLHGGLARFADRLMLYGRLLGQTRIPLTQEKLAIELGFQRTTITAYVSELVAQGVITKWRGSISIRNHAGLKMIACGCRTPILPCEALGARQSA